MMGAFPAESNLYLDEDVVIRSSGISEPRKEKIQKITRQILDGWQSKEYEELSAFLSELKRLQGVLPPEFEALSRRIPALNYCKRLDEILRQATKHLKNEEYKKAACCIGDKPSRAEWVVEDDRRAIEAVEEKVAALDEKIGQAWLRFLENTIRSLIKENTRGSLSSARKYATELTEIRFATEFINRLKRDFVREIEEAEKQLLISKMNCAVIKKSWKLAEETARSLLFLDKDSKDARTVLRLIKKRVFKQRLFVCCVVAFLGLVLGLWGMAHRRHLVEDFSEALILGKHETAISCGRKISKFDDRAAAYLQLVSDLEKVSAKQAETLKILEVETLPEWNRWTLAVSSVDNTGAGDPLFEEAFETARSAYQYFSSLLNNARRLYVSVSPRAAIVEVRRKSDGEVVFSGSLSSRGSLNLLLHSGSYTLKASEDKYHFKTLILDERFWRGRSRKEVSLNLNPFDGRVFVDSKIPASVWVDGKRKGNTGEWIVSPANIRTRFEVRASGYKTKTLSTTLLPAGDRTFHVDLDRAAGLLKMVATVSNSVFEPFLPKTGFLSVDGGSEEEVSLSHSKKMVLGPHELFLRIPGFGDTFEKTVTIAEDGVVRWNLSLMPLNSEVVFKSNLKDKKVKLYTEDGRCLGHAGEVIALSPFIRHAIFFRAKGYHAVAKSIRLPLPGKRYGDIHVEMTKRAR